MNIKIPGTGTVQYCRRLLIGTVQYCRRLLIGLVATVLYCFLEKTAGVNFSAMPAALAEAAPARLRLYLTLLLWICIYSGWNIIGRDVSTEGPILRLLIINCLRALVASVCCGALMLISPSSSSSSSSSSQGQRSKGIKGGSGDSASGDDTSRWVALGVVTCVMNNVYTLGLRWTTATNCAIFIATTPLWTYAGGLCLGMEVLDRLWQYRAAGFFLAILGAMVVQLGRAQAATDAAGSQFFRLFGNIVVLFAVCAISAYYLVVRSLASKYSAITITFVAQVSAFVYSLGIIVCMLAAEEAVPHETWATVVARLDLSQDVLFSGVYAGVCINVVCFGIEAWALRHASPGTVALFTALDPPITAVLSVVFLHERAGVSLFAGGALIICGLFVNAGVEEYVEKEGKKAAGAQRRGGGELVNADRGGGGGGGSGGGGRGERRYNSSSNSGSSGDEESARLLGR